jgi:hypothetical protein
MDNTAAIQKAQHEILQCLVRWEKSIGALYAQYARAFPSMSKFWSNLAVEEAGHARLLQAIEKLLDEGQIFWNIGQFTPEALHKELAFVDDAIDRAIHGKVGAREAVFAAVKIEAGMLESRFYSVIQSSSPGFAAVAEKLVRATENHVERIRAQLMETTDEERWQS